jgi:hypothetical protein
VTKVSAFLNFASHNCKVKVKRKGLRNWGGLSTRQIEARYVDCAGRMRVWQRVIGLNLQAELDLAWSFF